MPNATQLDHDRIFEIVSETVIAETRRDVGDLFGLSKIYGAALPKGFGYTTAAFARLLQRIQDSLGQQGIVVTLGPAVVKSCYQNSVSHLIAVVYALAVTAVAGTSRAPLRTGAFVMRSIHWMDK